MKASGGSLRDVDVHRRAARRRRPAAGAGVEHAAAHAGGEVARDRQDQRADGRARRVVRARTSAVGSGVCRRVAVEPLDDSPLSARRGCSSMSTERADEQPVVGRRCWLGSQGSIGVAQPLDAVACEPRRRDQPEVVDRRARDAGQPRSVRTTPAPRAVMSNSPSAVMCRRTWTKIDVGVAAAVDDLQVVEPAGLELADRDRRVRRPGRPARRVRRRPVPAGRRISTGSALQHHLDAARRGRRRTAACGAAVAVNGWISELDVGHRRRCTNGQPSG